VRAATAEAADSADFRSRVLDAVWPVVPFDSACIGTVDPTTLLPTALTTVGYDDPRAVLWAAQSEYGPNPPANSFYSVARLETPVRLSRDAGDERWVDSRHYAELCAPFGLQDELRMVFTARDGRPWGMATMARGPGRAFDHDCLRVLAPNLREIGEGMRVTLMRVSPVGRSEIRGAEQEGQGPAVVVVGPDNAVVDTTPLATELLQRISMGGAAPAMAALRFRHHGVESIRLRTHEGRWLVLRTGPFGDDRLAVTIEQARPPDVVALVAAVHGLTVREADVLTEVLAGHSREAIARALFISPYTVQDHLKSIFVKTGVNSRQGLVSQLVFDQYLPRLGSPVGSRGWFTEGGAAQPAEHQAPAIAR
jgi:DNA-binding CsgD family transcriptional regulator